MAIAFLRLDQTGTQVLAHLGNVIVHCPQERPNQTYPRARGRRLSRKERAPVGKQAAAQFFTAAVNGVDSTHTESMSRLVMTLR